MPTQPQSPNELPFAPIQDADRLYNKALHKAGGTTEEYELEHVPMIFNLARLYEEVGRYEECFTLLRYRPPQL